MEKIGNVTIRKRSNGKYEYRFEIEPLDGKRRWKSKGGFIRKKEAQEAGNKAREEYIRTGGKPERKQDNISVEALAEIWMQKILIKREPTTYITYESIIRTHILPAIGKKPVKQLDYSDIEALLQKLADDGRSKSTLEVTKAILTGMLGYAVKPMRITRYNPAKEAELPQSQKPKKERTSYTAAQIRQILEAVPRGSDYRMPIILGIYCGLRISEALGLTWDCVDLKENTITINKQLKNMPIDHKCYQVIKKPKNSSSCRTIHISSFVRSELLAEKKRQAAAAAEYGSFYYHIQIRTLDLGQNKTLDYASDLLTPEVGGKELQPVCRRECGKHMKTEVVTGFMRKLSKELEFKTDTHTGRHTHATLSIENGAGIEAVSARLGHSSPRTTSNYIHQTDRMDIDTMEKFEEALSTAE